jgi:hypothetical protein
LSIRSSQFARILGGRSIAQDVGSLKHGKSGRLHARRLRSSGWATSDPLRRNSTRPLDEYFTSDVMLGSGWRSAESRAPTLRPALPGHSQPHTKSGGRPAESLEGRASLLFATHPIPLPVSGSPPSAGTRRSGPPSAPLPSRMTPSAFQVPPEYTPAGRSHTTCAGPPVVATLLSFPL